MLKCLGAILLFFLFAVIFIDPLRNYMNNLFIKDRDIFSEDQVIGTVSTYNPRVEEAQEILNGVGFFTGIIDGVMGGKTRKAIKEFQKAKGLNPSGKIDSLTWLALSREEVELKTIPKKVPVLNLEQMKQEAEETIPDAALIRGPAQPALKPESASESKGTAKQIQSALKNARFYKGSVDGKIGPKTKKALKEFQKAHNLKADGVVGKKTAGKLNEYLKGQNF
jgi:peptidoglycan hydrolase-like protein with peptidoglycan-binding domain